MYAVQRLLIEIFCVFLLRIRKGSTAAFLLGNWSIFERSKNIMSEVISIFSGVQIEHCLYKPFQCQTNLFVPIHASSSSMIIQTVQIQSLYSIYDFLSTSL